LLLFFIDSFFTLLAFKDNAIVTLTEGISVSGTVSKSAYRYFRYFDSDPEEDLLFLLSSAATGDADLFISCFLRPRFDDRGVPSSLRGHHNFSSVNTRADDSVVVYSDDDDRKCTAGGGRSGSAGLYYVAVQGYAESTSFTMGAMHRGAAIVLRAGVPVTGMLLKDTSASYRLYVGAEVMALRVVLTELYGDMDLFVSINRDADDQTYDYSSLDSGQFVDAVDVPETAMCALCFVGVMVRANAVQSSSFSLLASFSDSTIALAEGVPLHSAVAADHTEYFFFRTPDSNGRSISDNAATSAGSTAAKVWSVDVVLTVLSGLPALFVSSSCEFPNATSSDTTTYFSRSDSGGLPHVTLPLIATGVTVYIGVGGDGSNSSYTVRVGLSRSVQAQASGIIDDYTTVYQLSDGFPQV
jgi:hypothetical protein